MLQLLNAGAAAAAAAAANQTTDCTFTPNDAMALVQIMSTIAIVAVGAVLAGIGLVWTLDKIFGGPDDP